jgi:hypothetical protein
VSALFKADEVTPLCAMQYGKVDKLKGEPPTRFSAKPHPGPIPIPEGHCGCSQTEADHWKDIQAAYFAGYNSERAPGPSPEVQALIQAAKLAEELITDAKCVQSVKWTNARTALRSALKPFAESAPEPLRLEITDEDRTMRWTIEDWQHEVRNGDTKLGWDEWILHKKEDHLFSPAPGE